MRRTWLSGAAGAVTLAAFCSFPATEVAAADWEWTIAPYIWGSGISLDMTANDEPVLGADASFSACSTRPKWHS